MLKAQKMKRISKTEAQQIITTDYQGIIPYHEVFYIRAIQFACERALLSFARFYEAIGPKENSQVAIYSLQEALVHCSTISRFFWPTKTTGLALARAEKLKSAFHVDDDSILKSRSIRNGIEHFDERLDSFLSQDKVGVFYDMFFGSVELAKNEVSQIIFLVDPEEEKVILFGEFYSYSGLNKEVQRINLDAIKMDSEGGRLSTKDKN